MPPPPRVPSLFNSAGPRIPEEHYMVPPAMRIAGTLPPRSGASALIGPLAALLAAACGDNAAPGDCAPPEPELPAAGPLRDPLALPLDGCVPGGLRDLPGRRFLAAAGAGFTFEYPRFEWSCEAGFQLQQMLG